jgi:hypothetical protein
VAKTRRERTTVNHKTNKKKNMINNLILNAPLKNSEEQRRTDALELYRDCDNWIDQTFQLRTSPIAMAKVISTSAVFNSVGGEGITHAVFLETLEPVKVGDLNDDQINQLRRKEPKRKFLASETFTVSTGQRRMALHEFFAEYVPHGANASEITEYDKYYGPLAKHQKETIELFRSKTHGYFQQLESEAGRPFGQAVHNGEKQNDKH